MRILRASDYRVMPWKNGGGTTTEIAVSPEGAALDAFDWRVSMARVETDGPFSLFPGIDRTLSVLDGRGMILSVAGRIPFGLLNASEPLSFPADVATSAALIAGPIVDLNVMTRRGRMRHSVERSQFEGSAEISVGSARTLVFCHRGPVQVEWESEAVLVPHDTLCVGRGTSVLKLSARNRAIVFVIRIDAIAQND